eukprot:g42060.t1
MCKQHSRVRKRAKWFPWAGEGLNGLGELEEGLRAEQDVFSSFARRHTWTGSHAPKQALQRLAARFTNVSTIFNWERTASMSQERGSCALAVLQGDIYAIGGVCPGLIHSSA